MAYLSRGRRRRAATCGAGGLSRSRLWRARVRRASVGPSHGRSHGPSPPGAPIPSRYGIRYGAACEAAPCAGRSPRTPIWRSAERYSKVTSPRNVAPLYTCTEPVYVFVTVHSYTTCWCAFTKSRQHVIWARGNRNPNFIARDTVWTTQEGHYGLRYTARVLICGRRE